MHLEQSRSERTFPYAVAVLLLPLLVLWHHDDPLYTPLWQSDPWFYLGYFRDFVNFKRELFPNAYYGSRLSWILPGYAVHHLFSPLIANAVLHLIVHSVAALSLFSILRSTIGLRSAYLTAMIFSLHPWLWCATGWDHVNGAGIAYGLLAMALLTRAALHPPARGILVLAGAALAGSVYAHLFLAVLAFLVLLYYLGLRHIRGRRQLLHAVLGLGLWAGLGFVAFSVPLCAVNYRVEGNPWFWSPSLRTANSVVRSYIWTESIWNEHTLVPWLWFIVMGTAVAVFLLPLLWRRGARGTNRTALLFCGQLLLFAALMAYLQSRGITLLAHYYYACYLLPFVFLVVGATFWPATENMSVRAYLYTASAATLLFGALWYDPRLNEKLPQWVGLALAGSALLVALAFRERRLGTGLAICGLALLTSATYTGSYRFVDLHSTRDEYLRVMQTRQRIEDRRGDAPIQFWYDKREPGFFEYFALNASYFAEFNRINETFPQGCPEDVNPRSLIVITSSKEHPEQLARVALDQCWQPFGVQPAIDSVEQIRGSKGHYTMAILRVEARQPSAYKPEEVLADVPLQRLQLAAPGVSFERWPEGLEVNTLPDFGAFAARLNLGLDPHREGKFKVIVRARVLEGKAGFGILDSSGKRFLVERLMWPLSSIGELVLPLPSPPVVGDFVVNNRTTNGTPSSVLIESIEIRSIP